MPTVAECAAQALSGHTKILDDQQFVRESLQTHIPEYVLKLYRQTALGFMSTDREAYLASLLTNIAAFESKAVCPEHKRAQIPLQEHDSCFKLINLDEIVVFGCDKPEFQDGVKQLFICSAQAEHGPVRCA